MNPLLPAVLAGAGAALAVRPEPLRRLAHLSIDSRARRPWSRGVALSAGTAGTTVVGIAVAGVSRGLVVGALAVVVAVAAQVVLGRRDDRTRATRAHAVSRAARVLAGQLRIGQVPSAALRSAASDCPPLERAAATLAIGGDVAVALRDVAAVPGNEGLLTLAMAWELSETSGAPIASLVRQVGESLRAADESRAQVDAELSGPRASGRLLAMLPALGLGLGRLAGGDPFHFLSATVWGHACVLLGAVLAGAGVLWTEHLAAAAHR